MMSHNSIAILGMALFSIIVSSETIASDKIDIKEQVLVIYNKDNQYLYYNHPSNKMDVQNPRFSNEFRKLSIRLFLSGSPRNASTLFWEELGRKYLIYSVFNGPNNRPITPNKHGFFSLPQYTIAINELLNNKQRAIRNPNNKLQYIRAISYNSLDSIPWNSIQGNNIMLQRKSANKSKSLLIEGHAQRGFPYPPNKQFYKNEKDYNCELEEWKDLVKASVPGCLLCKYLFVLFPNSKESIIKDAIKAIEHFDVKTMKGAQEYYNCILDKTGEKLHEYFE